MPPFLLLFLKFGPTSLHAFVTLRKIPRLSVIHHFMRLCEIIILDLDLS